MAVNKVIFGNVTLIDTSEVTVTPDKMFKGETALGANGEMQTGTFTIAEELSEQDALLTELETVLAGKAAGGGSAPVSSFPTCTVNVDATADLNMVIIINGVFCWPDAENIVPCGDLNVIYVFVENASFIEDICFDVADTDGYTENYRMNEFVYADNDRIYGLFEGLAAGAHVTVSLVMAE